MQPVVSPARRAEGRRAATPLAASEFATLLTLVREAGLMRRRRGRYLVRGTILVAALLGILAAAVAIGDSWYQLLPAALVGVVLSQFGFLAHDAAHRQVFAGPATNEWWARVMSTLVIGLSYGWWLHKHTRHHRSPNQVDRDPDIAPGGLVFSVEDARRRPRWTTSITRRQGYLFFAMLFLEGVNLHVAGVRTLLQRRDLPHRTLEGALIALHFAAGVAVLQMLMSPSRAVAFIAVQLGVFGFLLGAAFAPNHKGMPLVPPDAKIDFLRRQVLMSRNVRGGPMVDVVMGGLNYQIEHHLFPSMPRDNLRRARPIVRAFCAERGVPYTETSLMASYRQVMRYLNQVGLKARDPFACPFVTAYR